MDPVLNFGKVTVSTGYDSAATTVVLTSGHGDRLPSPSADGAFNLVWWNATDYTDPADDPNREIVRVTARSADTLTVTRGTESTSPSNKNTSGKTYKMILAPTKKSIDDMRNSMAASYVIYKSGSTINAMSGVTGKIIYSGTDAATVINSVISALTAAGGRILIKAGTYTLNAAIVPKDNLCIEGEGRSNSNGTILQIANGANIYMFNTGTVATSNVTLKNLYADCNRANNTTAGFAYFYRAFRNVFSELYITHFTTAINIDADIYGSWNQNIIKNCVFDCVEFNPSGSMGIRLKFTDENFIYSNVFINIEYGLEDEAGLNLIQKNVFLYNTAGLRIYGSNADVINGNIFDRNKKWGLLITSSERIVISNNHFFESSNPYPNTYDDLAISTSGKHNIIIGNIFNSINAKYNINCNSGVAGGFDNVKIINNSFIANTTGAIGKTSDSLYIIKNNTGYNPQPVAAITPAGSPYTYTNNDGYTEQVQVVGGTVSDIALVRSTVETSLGITAGIVTLESGDGIKVTYTGAPTMRKIPM